MIVSLRRWTLSLVLALTATGALAADPGAASTWTDRLFLSFAEDATVAQKQWWEGRLVYEDGSSDLPWDRTIVQAQAALTPIRNLEFGGRVGFGSTDAPGGIPDGSGATDFDIWAKYLFPNRGGFELAVGGLATVPTGDETAGLGADAFSLKAFGALRYPLTKGVFTANVGIRTNGDGRLGPPSAPDLDGKTSVSAGVGVILPFSSQVAVIGEASMETERFDGLDSDVRVLAGVNWRPASRGVVRAAAGLGLTDGAPDVQIVAGYALAF